MKLIKEEGVCYQSHLFHRFGLSLSAIFGFWRDVKQSKGILINGIFTFPVTLAAFYAVLLRKPFIVAVRGGLEPWRVAHKKWKKYLYVRFITLPLMRKAKYIHVTSNLEEETIRRLGFTNTILIPNGIDPDDFKHKEKSSTRWEFPGLFIFLFISRMDREKGLDMLIEGYREFGKQFPSDRYLLLLVGPDNQDYLKKMNINYERENIEYIDGVYGEEKVQLYNRADAVVLPSYSESFGNVIAEAMACGTPVITTTETPWNMIEELNCGYYIHPDVKEILNAMTEIFQKSGVERKEMGKRGKDYIIENFRWDKSAKLLYEYLSGLANEITK